MAVDPVCGMNVRQRGNKQSVEYADQTYFFCSSGCLERFDAQPDLFTAGPGEGKLADRDRGVLPGHGAKVPRPSAQAKLEQPPSDAGPG
jgi:YHS domain-containing protein